MGDICHGAGQFTQSRDPSEHTDWWKIGGRWDRCFRERDDATTVYASPLGGNVIPVHALPKTWIPAVIVTPDGLWYASPLSFDFGNAETMSQADRAEIDLWKAEAASLLEEHRGCNIVAVDCHT